MNHEQSTNANRSQALYRQARQVLPGGISRNTVFRQPHPNYFASGKGCRVTDIEGNSFVDFSNNMASLIHGHAHPEIVRNVTGQLARGSAVAMATEAEVRFASLMCERVPSCDKIRFVNSGTEAVMVAIKAARCFTGRPKIAKVEGAYHGTYDYAETSQKSKPSNWGQPDRPASVPVAEGTPQRALEDVVIIPFNDVDRSLAILEEHASEIACILIDPLPHRVGLIPAEREFVQALYDWTRRHQALFVFDEVITFRSEFEGAQAWYDIVADLTAMGKIIGGGFPVGAIGGSDHVMSVLDPTRPHLPFPHSGTFSANPITMTAGRTAMELFDRESVDRLNQLAQRAREGIAAAILETGIAASVTGAGSMFRVHLKSTAPIEYRTTYMDEETTNNISWLVDFMLNRGFLMINTCSAALSTAMTDAEVDAMVAALADGFRELNAIE